ncbi:MAG: PAS domain-containing sensor histidine kinase [Ktedonobacteraceae bacterium]|nr:PAS domain-containing sensor histidine kinase [Ktedonobacteraceae bacterium]
MVEDINQQEESVQSEYNFRLLADSMPQIVWTARRDGWLDYYNQKWFDYTGMTFAQTQGWGWAAALHPDDLQQSLEAWMYSVKTGEAFEIEYRLKQAPDAIYRWHLSRALPVRDEQGRVTQWFGTSTDIQNEKFAEQRLAHQLSREQEARKEAEQAGMTLLQLNQAQRNFIAVISHEFRATLTSIQGFSALLRDEDFDASETREYADDIHTDALRLHRMIDNLLDLEKIRAGKIKLSMEAVDLNALLKEAIERTRQISLWHTISFQRDERLPTIEADHDKIMQVVINLLSNAVKYSPHGGEIRVTCTLEEADVHVSVQDEGMGIQPDLLDQIFIPYSRIHSAATQYIQGAGLGLPIVRQLVEMHAGKVWVESELEHGSCFHFMLPLRLPIIPSPANEIDDMTPVVPTEAAFHQTTTSDVASSMRG